MLDAAIVVAETLSIRRRILCGDSCRHKNEGGILTAGARICQLAQSASLRSGPFSSPQLEAVYALPFEDTRVSVNPNLNEEKTTKYLVKRLEKFGAG
jgi:hypothetical protein